MKTINTNEPAEKLTIVRGLTDAIGRLEAKKSRTIEDCISLAQLKQRRKSLQALLKPTLVVKGNPPVTNPAIKVGSMVGI